MMTRLTNRLCVTNQVTSQRFTVQLRPAQFLKTCNLIAISGENAWREPDSATMAGTVSLVRPAEAQLRPGQWLRRPVCPRPWLATIYSLSLSVSLTHSLVYSLTHSFARSLSVSLAHSLTRSLSLSHSLARSLSLSHSLAHSFTLFVSLTRSLALPRRDSLIKKETIFQFSIRFTVSHFPSPSPSQ